MTITHDYYGYDQDYEGESVIALECPYCTAHIEFSGYDEVQIDADTQVFTLDEWDRCECPACGATFGEGATLEVVNDDANACGGFGCVDGCGDCAPVEETRGSLFSVLFEQAERELGERIGYPALVYAPKGH